jgi:hypothetical protein
MPVSLADPGFFDGFKEIGALTKHLAEAQAHWPAEKQKAAGELQN